MSVGWHAKLKKAYINDLRKVLGIKIKTTSVVAYDVLVCINDELYEKNKNGDFFVIMNFGEWTKTKGDLKPQIPIVNFQSWMMGCMVKMNRNKALLNRFNTLVEFIPEKFTRKEFEDYFFRFFNKKYWSKDVDNFIAMLYYTGPYHCV